MCVCERVSVCLKYQVCRECVCTYECVCVPVYKCAYKVCMSTPQRISACVNHRNAERVRVDVSV